MSETVAAQTDPAAAITAVEPVSAPVTEAIATPAPEVVAAEPVATPEAAAEAAPVEVPKADAPKSSLVGGATAATEAKPADGEAAPAEAAPESAPAVAYEAFNIPEGFKSDDAQMKSFTDTLGKYGASQELGQALIDMHAAEVQRIHDVMQNQNREVWQNTRDQWVDQIRKDPQIGGNRFHTTVNEIATFMDNYANHEVRQVLDFTGAGDHPAFVKWVHSLAQRLAPPTPIPATKPPPAPVSRAQRRYAGSMSR